MIPRISSAFSEPWIGWLLLGLLILWVIAISLSPGMIRQSFTTLFKHKERENLFDEGLSTNFVSHLLLWVFKIALFSLALQYALLQTGNSTCALRVIDWLIIAGSLSVFYLLRTGLLLLLAYVFDIQEGVRLSNKGYEKLTTCGAVILYPILLILLFGIAFEPRVEVWILVVWYASLALVYVAKLSIIWVRSIKSILYLTLYLLTAVIIPRVGLLLIINNSIF